MADHVRTHSDTNNVTTDAGSRVANCMRNSADTHNAIDSSFNPVLIIVGHAASTRGWLPDVVSEALIQEIEAGSAWTVVLEDYLDYRQLFDVWIKITNPQSRMLNVVLTQVVPGDPNTSGYVLANEGLSGHDLLELPINQSPPYGIRVQDSPVQLKHIIVITNNEPENAAKAVLAYGGWSPRATKLPLHLPEVVSS